MKKSIAYILTSLLSISIIQAQIVPNIHQHLVQGYIKKHIPTYRHVFYQQLGFITLIASYYLSRFSKNIPTKYEEDIQYLLKKNQGDLHRILRKLSHNNRTKHLKRIIQRYPEINLNHQSPTTGDTALHHAAREKYFNAFKILIDHGALIHIENNLGESVWDMVTNPNGGIAKFPKYLFVNPEGKGQRKPQGLYTTMPSRNFVSYLFIVNNFNQRNFKKVLVIGPGIYLTYGHKTHYPRFLQRIKGTSPSLAEAMAVYSNADFDIIDIFDIAKAIEKTKQQKNYAKVLEYYFKHNSQLSQYAQSIDLSFNTLLHRLKLDFTEVNTSFIHEDLFDVRLKKSHYDFIDFTHILVNENAWSKQSKKMKNMFCNLINALKKQGILLIDYPSFMLLMCFDLNINWLECAENQYNLFCKIVKEKYNCSTMKCSIGNSEVEFCYKNNKKYAFYQGDYFPEKITCHSTCIVTKR